MSLADFLRALCAATGRKSKVMKKLDVTNRPIIDVFKEILLLSANDGNAVCMNDYSKCSLNAADHFRLIVNYMSVTKIEKKNIYCPIYWSLVGAWPTTVHRCISHVSYLA